MDGATLQARIYSGYAKAAARIGLPHDVYRSASMLNPLAVANRLISALPASMTTGMAYSAYNKPKIPDWILIADASQLIIGDWLVGGQGTFYVSDMQPLLPIPVVQCNHVVNIMRPSYSIAGSLEQTETQIASAFPVFMQSKRDKDHTPAGFPTATESATSLPMWITYINAHRVSDIQKNDVIVDENGARYIIDVPDLTSFGYIVETHIEMP
jgi:hypothetical protein